MLDKKGFLFTVTVFLVLTYILLSISVWVKAIESSERAFSEFYKESTVELTIEQITPDKMDGTAFIIMNRNLERVNTRAKDFAVNAGPPEDENLYTRALLQDLLVNGSASSEYFEPGAPALEPENTSLRAWVTNLNASLKAIGIYVSEFTVSDFTIGQSAINKLNYSFNLTLQLKDFAGTTSVYRQYPIRGELSLSGRVDPALARESNTKAGDEKTAYRQFFFSDKYEEPSEVSVSRISSISSGQGWFYGPMVMASGSDGDLVPEYSVLPPQPTSYVRNDYILVGTFDEINALGPDIYSQFGGYIITTAPLTSESACPDAKDEKNTFNPVSYTKTCEVVMDSTAGIVSSKPFAVVRDFKPSEKAPECPLLDNSSESRRCVLMVSRYSESEVGDDWSKKNAATQAGGLYGVEDMRTFVMCGYYTHNPDAPSYLQRLLPDPYLRNDTNYGIETFVIGNYANDYGVYAGRSRLDRELFNETIDGIKIRGLPGCKSFSACSDKPITGVFAVSEGAKDDYGLDKIACDNKDAAGCDTE